VPQAVSQVDILPTLIDIVHNSNGTPKPEPIDPLDGRSLLPLCKGNDSEDPDICYSEYLGEGAKSPMLMIRKGYLKYISCSDDPEQLFNLKTDPDERVNCIDDTRYTSQAEEFRMLAKSHWNSDKLREKIIADQIRRRRVHEALRIGKYESWDYQPYRDASNEFTRSHLDLTKFDISSRFPRPKPFLPKKK
jgi:choline-sulfatase